MSSTDNTSASLEPEVIQQLKNGRKINAIKKLRELRGIGLKEAKELVDAYCDENEVSTSSSGTVTRGSGNSVIGLIAIGIIAYVLYRFFS